MNINFAELARLRESRIPKSPTKSRNKDEDKQILIIDIIGVDEDYNPKDIYDLINEEEDDLTILGVEKLFNIDEYDNKRDKKYYNYVKKLIEEIKYEYKEEMEILSSRKQITKQKQREQKIDKYVNEILPYKMIIDAQHFNARKNLDFDENTAFMSFEDILITKNKNIINECLLSVNLYDQIVSTNIFKQLTSTQKSYPYLVIRNKSGVVVSLLINQNKSSGNNSIEIPEDVYLFLSDIKIKDLELKINVPTNIDAYLFVEPHIGSVVFRSVGNCGEVSINIEELSNLIDENYFTLYLGQRIDYPGCNLLVANMKDENDNPIMFGSTSKIGMEIIVKLDLVMEEQDLYKIDKVWDKY